MAVDLKAKFDSGFLYHSMSVRKTRRCLELLEDEDILIPNTTANLAVYRGNPLCYVGFINFFTEEVELFTEEEL